MSIPTPSAEETISEFASAIDDIREFVITSKKRALHDTQLKVIIKNKIGRIKTASNTLASHITMDSESRSQAFFDSIPKLIDVLNAIKQDGMFELIWLEINALINSFAASLITFHSKGDIWTVQGSATLLVQIISGIPKVENLPALTDGSSEDPDFLDRWFATFNCLQYSAATFTGVIYAIKTVKLTDLIYWANQAFYYYSLLEEFFNLFKWEKIANAMKKRPQTFFVNVFTISTIFQGVIDHCLLLFKRLGLDWPTEIYSYNIFDDHSIPGLFNLIQHIRQFSKIALAKITELNNTGIWSLNDNPFESDAIKNLIDFDKIYDYYTSYVKALEVAVPFIDKKTEKKEILETLDKALELNNWYLSYTENQVGDRENLLTSFLGTQFIDIANRRLELLALESIFSQSITVYKSKYQEIDWIFHKADPLQYSDIFLRKLFVELFLSTKISPIYSFEELLAEIIRLKNLLEFRPRDITALVVLELITEMFLDKCTLPNKEKIFVTINKSGLINGGDYHLFDEFQDYIEFLLLSFQGGPSFMGDQLLRHKTSINPFDSNTWLIPDFNKPFKGKYSIPIYYLPFNRSGDGIIDDS